MLLREPAQCKVRWVVREASVFDEQCIHAHFVNPLPSSLTTIQQAGSRVSSNSNFFTYSKRLLAILDLRGGSCDAFAAQLHKTVFKPTLHVM